MKRKLLDELFWLWLMALVVEQGDLANGLLDLRIGYTNAPDTITNWEETNRALAAVKLLFIERGIDWQRQVELVQAINESAKRGAA